MPYKGLKNACSESKQLDRLSGFETQISYDPTTKTVYADTNPIGNTVVYHAPIVELGKIKHPMTMQELSAWLDAKIDERNAENRWHKEAAWAHISVKDSAKVPDDLATITFDYCPMTQTPQQAFAALMNATGKYARVVSPVEVEVDDCVYIVDADN